MSGIVQGGWEFVVAAYIATAATLTGYAVSVFLRLSAEKRAASLQPEPEAHE